MLTVAANALIKVTPGLMIWTIVCFLIALFVLKRYAFGPIQGAIDARRERIRTAVDEADRAREEARSLLEEHRKLVGRAKQEAEEILAEGRKRPTPSGSASARRRRPTGSAGSRRPSARSRPRRSARSSRSAPRSPT